jgi:ABC-2 type transport system permease protein
MRPEPAREPATTEPIPLHPGGAAAPVGRRVIRQGAFDARVMLGNGEQVLLTIVLPMLILVGLARTSVPDLGPGRRIDVATPGIIALAVISTAFTGQAIATGFDRRYGVLRMLGTTPLGRSGLLGGRFLAVCAVQALQITMLGGIAAALGWAPAWSGLAPAVVAVLVGTAAFVALGLLLAGTLRAEAVLAVANLVWVLLLAGGGVLIPPTRMGTLAEIAGVLPSGALAQALRTALHGGSWAPRELVVLMVWAAGATLAASRWFRWD